MTQSDDTTDSAAKRGQRAQWLQLGVGLVLLVALSFGFAYLLAYLAARFDLPLHEYAWLAYLLVFGSSVLSNLTIIAPVPFGASVIVAAATVWNPVLTALFASFGAVLGEMSGYYAGYLGKKFAILEETRWYRRVESWIHRYGVWAIAFLSFQPVIPFDIGGLIAGAARMPLYKFLPALWAGRFPKYVILVYAALGLVHFIPFLP
ncbi:MAG: YqaA family protein [Chloroflexota bacterium]